MIEDTRTLDEMARNKFRAERAKIAEFDGKSLDCTPGAFVRALERKGFRELPKEEFEGRTHTGDMDQRHDIAFQGQWYALIFNDNDSGSTFMLEPVTRESFDAHVKLMQKTRDRDWKDIAGKRFVDYAKGELARIEKISQSIQQWLEAQERVMKDE